MTKKDDSEDYADAVVKAVNMMVKALHMIAAKQDICALCIAHAFSDYVEELEKRGIAIHRSQSEDEPETIEGGTIH